MMQKSLRLWRAENLKERHSIGGKLWILMPVLTFLLAYGISQQNGVSSAYNWWYTTMLPGMTALAACLHGEKDKKLSERAALCLPAAPKKLWDAKVAVCMKTVVLANVLGGGLNLILGNYLIPRFWISQSLELGVFETIQAAAVMTVTVLWQVPFCLLLYYRWGILPALIVNMVMNIAGVVMAPGPFWILNPWAAPSRLMTGVIGVLPNGLLAIPGSVTYTPGIEGSGAILPGVVVTALWLVLCWAVSRIWYVRKGAQAV